MLLPHCGPLAAQVSVVPSILRTGRSAAAPWVAREANGSGALGELDRSGAPGRSTFGRLGGGQRRECSKRTCRLIGASRRVEVLMTYMYT